MERREVFNEYYSKLALEGLLKSLMVGLIFGLGAAFVSSFVAWLLIRSGMVVAFILFVTVTAGATAYFYIKKFQPTTKSIAHRVDRLGLQERAITMLELENDESYIAFCQREEAKSRISHTNPNQMKIKFLTIPTLIIVCALFAISLGMAIISQVSAQGNVAWRPGGLSEDISGKVFEVNYIADVGGTIMGDTIQLVRGGESSQRVMPVADEMYKFDSWSDGYEFAERYDQNVSENITVIAYFSEVVDPMLGEAGDTPSDKPMQKPLLPQDLNEESPKEPSPSNPDDTGGDSSGGSEKPTNQIIDGDTYYRMVYQEYYLQAVAYLENNQEIPDYLRSIIESYFGIIL